MRLLIIGTVDGQAVEADVDDDSLFVIIKNSSKIENLFQSAEEMYFTTLRPGENLKFGDEKEGSENMSCIEWDGKEVKI